MTTVAAGGLEPLGADLKGRVTALLGRLGRAGVDVSDEAQLAWAIEARRADDDVSYLVNALPLKASPKISANTYIRHINAPKSTFNFGPKPS